MIHALHKFYAQYKSRAPHKFYAQYKSHAPHKFHVLYIALPYRRHAP